MIMAFLLFAFVSTSALPQRPTALLQPGHNSTVGSDNLGLSESVFLASSAQEGTYFPCERQKKHCESWCAKSSAPWTSKWCARLALLPLLRRGTVPTTAHPRFMDALWMPVPSLAQHLGQGLRRLHAVRHHREEVRRLVQVGVGQDLVEQGLQGLQVLP